MRLEDIARVYVTAVELDEHARANAPELADEAGALRADLHALLMQSLRENNIPFTDRLDASRIAYKINHKIPA